MKLFLPALLLFAATADAQWAKVPIPTTASLRGLSVVSDYVIWASGTDGTVIRTGDGGKTWSVLAVPGAEKLDFRGIWALDERTAVIMSSGLAQNGQARIYRTADAGRTWKQVYEQKMPGIFFDAIAFWDRKHGILLSDPVNGRFAVFTTDDSGETWKQVPSAVLPPALPNEGAFAASNSCLTVQGEKNVWFATGGANIARVFRSRNRGRNWAVSDTPMHPANASSGIFSLAFQDASFGVAVGGDYAHAERSDLPNLLLTSDGGKTWREGKPTDPPGLYLSSVTILRAPPGSGAKPIRAAGIKGMYIASAVSDASWQKETEENLNAVVYSVYGTWAVGPKGIVLREVLN